MQNPQCRALIRARRARKPMHEGMRAQKAQWHPHANRSIANNVTSVPAGLGAELVHKLSHPCLRADGFATINASQKPFEGSAE